MKKIPLTQGQFAIVDVVDFEWLSQWNWCADKRRHANKDGPSFYAMRRGWDKETKTPFKVRMHREIISAPKGMQVDHINGNSLDNRRANLRLATLTQNLQNLGIQRNNKSGFKGVFYNCPGPNPWRANIRHKGKCYHLGCFKTKRLAAVAYNQAAVKFFGEFARLNDV